MRPGMIRLVLGLTAIPLIAGGALAAAAQAPTYDIIELGTLGGASSRAFAINDQGWAVGHADTAEGRRHAALWKDGEIVDLGTLGGDEATALGINEGGQIVGNSATEPGSDADEPGARAFLWENGRMRNLGVLGGDTSTAHGINARGQIVGASTTAPGQTLDVFADGPRAVLWEDGRMTDLGTLGGGRSWALAINDAGQIVGTSATAAGEDHAFLWEDGRMTDLGALPDGQAIPFDVNRHSQIVGGSSSGAGQEFFEDGTRAVSWKDGAIAPMASAADPDGIAFGLTDRGEAVGSDVTGAVLWRGQESAPFIDLLDQAHGWDSLAVARAVNERGQIAGWGERDGAVRAFLASPPALRGTPGASPAALDATLDATEIVSRSQRAVREAGSYRFETFPAGETDGEPTHLGDVQIGVGSKTLNGDGSNLENHVGQTSYTQRPDGGWLVRDLPSESGDPLLNLLAEPAAAWVMRDPETVGGQSVFVLERTSNIGVSQVTHTLWIDEETLLPLEIVWRIVIDGQEMGGNETVYADFGAPVDIRPPAAALAPTPTPEPLPETGVSIEIVSFDIYYEPNAIAIPANEDVTVVLPNEGVTNHNVSIDELGISVDIPWGTTERIVVNAPPGVYEFYCDIPGHRQAGQVGTLTVDE